MARPRKCRRICQMPRTTRFAPEDGGAGEICMSLDEFESIRLIDLEHLQQEECALRMNVARTTVQSIYLSARSKLAEALVAGKSLRIAGENLEISTYSYGEGQASILDVLQAQLSWIQLYTNAIQSRYNYAVAVADYRRITATPAEE